MNKPALLDRHRQRLFDAPATAADPIGIYIHIPFCSHICPYCDFNTYAGKESLIPSYLDALQCETAFWARDFGGRRAQSIFIGGGTPSLLDPKQIRGLLDTCRAEFSMEKGAEVTIESNPNDVSLRYCVGLLEAGVNRISIGAQTLDRPGLRVLGRLHESDTVSSAVSAARDAGFANVSLDLIYGWPGQSIATWHNDLGQIMGGAIGGSIPDHLSLYGLIIEPGTPMADAVTRGILSPVDEDTSADFAELAASLLAAAGWIHYEIANWCAAPRNASVHNALYWRNGDYAGIGAGAHGHAGQLRTMNQPSPARYTKVVSSGESPRTNIEIIDANTDKVETMMLGLRLIQDGVSLDRFQSRHGISLEAHFGTQIAHLRDQGLLECDEHSVRLTVRGAMVANTVCAEFL
ncbi:MAG: radical SAM family heme chaperone HemW [Chloroflexota bacterium]|nr:radical SAM family heme chaperone HemW [Chloroflexota bacterium]